ncbi:k+ homeostasis protein kha1 protein [Apiospora arundinis]
MATATITVTAVLTTTVKAPSSSAPSSSSTNRATPQGGILEGVLPNEYSASDPIKLFIIQAGIIIILCHLLHYPLSRFGQPRVIAEVIGGILLGPSVLSRIHGFRDAIFPAASMPVLNNAANLGLVLFLFLIALEVDIRLFTANWRVALTVGLAGMILPFGLGCAVAWGLYHQFHNIDGSGVVPINFGVYALFIGTALAITAFPVLCRILSELNLLRTPVGVTVLAAGVGNDVVGWILLALCVALVNNSSGVAALYVLLVAVGWVLVLVYVVRPAFHWVLRRTGSIQNGPTQGMVGLSILLVLTSAWFTGIIGVHPIFGGFLVGLICPHDGGFAIKLTEKIEDLVTVLFLPLYFALSGLNTDLGLLNDGMTWAYVVAVCAIAFAGKIIGGTLAAKANQLVWRESLTIGCLMSCKGLVELIVLNIGLQAKILSQTTFTIFVVMALVTTVSTTPLAKWLYPPWYQKKLEQWKRGEIDWEGNTLLASPEDINHDDNNNTHSATEKLQDTSIRRLLVYLRIDSLPSIFTFISLLGEETEIAKLPPVDGATALEQGNKTPVVKKRPLEVHGLRILELTDRTSSVMKVTESNGSTRRDPVLNTFKTFSHLHDVAVSGSVVVAPEDAYAQTVTAQAAAQESDFVLIPWSEGGSSKHTDDQPVPPARTSSQDRFSGRSQHEFLQNSLANAVCNMGIFISNGFGSGITAPDGLGEKAQGGGLSHSGSGLSLRSHKETAQPPIADKSHHVFFPFIGGVDDRAALCFVVQLCRSPHVTATIAQLRWAPSANENSVNEDDEAAVASGLVGDVKHEVKAEEAAAQDSTIVATVRGSLPPALVKRINFTEVSISDGEAMESALNLAKEMVGQNARNAGDIVVVGRRHPKPKRQYIAAAANGVSGGAGSDSVATNVLENQDMAKTVGVLGERLALGGLKASILVIQAAGVGLE